MKIALIPENWGVAGITLVFISNCRKCSPSFTCRREPQNQSAKKKKKIKFKIKKYCAHMYMYYNIDMPMGINYHCTNATTDKSGNVTKNISLSGKPLALQCDNHGRLASIGCFLYLSAARRQGKGAEVTGGKKGKKKKKGGKKLIIS